VVQEPATCLVTLEVEPFAVDGWRVSDQEDFNKLIARAYQALTESSDVEDAKMLCIRFLAFGVVECEAYFDALFGIHPTQDYSVQRLLDDAYKLRWIKEKTGQALKTFIKKYIAEFQAGMPVEYRNLDDNGAFRELVKATIVKVHYELGSYMIRFDDNINKDTIVYRI
jgi:hypothetical protein